MSEGDGSVTVFVEIKQGTVGGGETVTLEFTTRDNTATSMSATEEYLYLDILNFFFLASFSPGSLDYTSTTQTLSFTSGQTIGNRIPITISIVNDNITESIESFLEVYHFNQLVLTYLFLQIRQRFP